MRKHYANFAYVQSSNSVIVFINWFIRQSWVSTISSNLFILNCLEVTVLWDYFKRISSPLVVSDKLPGLNNKLFVDNI